MVNVCPREKHEKAKQHGLLYFLYRTNLIGVQDYSDPDEVLVLGNCVDCPSTIALPVRPGDL